MPESQEKVIAFGQAALSSGCNPLRGLAAEGRLLAALPAAGRGRLSSLEGVLGGASQCPPHPIFKAISDRHSWLCESLFAKVNSILNIFRCELDNTVVLNFTAQVVAVSFSASSPRTFCHSWCCLLTLACTWGHWVLRPKLPFSLFHPANSWLPLKAWF